MFTKEKSKANNLCNVYLHEFPTDLWKQIKVSAVLKGATVVEEMVEAVRFYVEALSAKKK